MRPNSYGDPRYAVKPIYLASYALHPDETTRDLFFSSIWNSGEADMLSGQQSETTSLILSRPERSGCGNGLPNPVTGAHGLAVKGEFVQPC